MSEQKKATPAEIGEKILDMMANKPQVMVSAHRKGDVCYYSYEESLPDNETNKISVKPTMLMHDDLLNAFNSLVGHFALICEEIGVKQIKDISIPEFTSTVATEKSQKLFVLGVKYDGASVSIVGSKLLKTGDELKLETPHILISDYKYRQELQVAVDELEAEVFEYHNGKHAPKAQQEIEFEEDLETDENNTEDDNDREE